MPYVFATIKEVITMQLKDMTVISELGREIYAVRFMGKLEDIKKESTKLVLTISDDEATITTIAYPHISRHVEKAISNIKIGDKAIIFAHLEPTNKICYIDIIKKPNEKEELEFMAGLFLTYFKHAFNINNKKTIKKRQTE